MIGERVAPPIPVEDVIERFLGLDLTYENLDEKLGMEDVLGATYVKSKRIAINRRLLEDRNEGRLVFTCAHEVGHWVLHRHLVEEAARTPKGSRRPSSAGPRTHGSPWSGRPIILHRAFSCLFAR
jgi:hypothetical protein